MLDRIDYNIEQTNVQVKEAVVQLDQVREVLLFREAIFAN
jgi:hypothetical protein